MTITPASAAAEEAGDGYLVRSLGLTFREGAVIHAHDHPWGQLVYTRSGSISVASDAMIWFTPPTRAIWLPPPRRHALTVRRTAALRTLYLSPHLTKDRLPAEAAVLEVSPLLRELVPHILKIGMLSPANAAQARLAGVLMDLLEQAEPQDMALPLPADLRARTFAERLCAAPDARQPLADAAREAGASLRTLQRTFLRETGMTLDAWRQKARLIHAAAILSAGAPVTTAALDCGYDSVSAFIAAFRRQFGTTPGQYRLARGG